MLYPRKLKAFALVVNSSNEDDNMSVIKEVSADKFVFVENIRTEKSARNIGIDMATHHLSHIIEIGK